MQSNSGRTKPCLNLIVIGDAGQGKTTLTAALTHYSAKFYATTRAEYKDLCEGKEEISGNARYKVARVEYETHNRICRQLDFPDHTDCVKYLESGAAKVDGAILVFSQTDDSMLVVKTQLKLCRAAGVEHLVVFLNKKVETMDPELLELMEMKISDLLNAEGFNGDDAHFQAGSALTANNDELDCPVYLLMGNIEAEIPLPERGPLGES
ncbi:hypothetical protein HU720_14340 [Pseudomonas sp. SWRI51]|uniref:GTP-binding protein n=1 Tax=Pseudomonas sp. SWRI51 TaxID=2745491 RepID=UPI0016473E25|nr:GTP-binding protein [Pseudomonas sp. SWRI51]MBC3412478.1 hypothetical protein [Pseudomonas sp. SWRI51]